MPYRGTRRWANQQYRNDAYPYSSYNGAGPRAAAAFDVWSLLEPVSRRWQWPLVVGLVLLGVGVLFATRLWSTSYTTTAQLIYTAPANPENGYRARSIAIPTLGGLLRAPELLRRVGAYTQPALTPSEVDRAIRLTPERDSEILTVTASGATLQQSVDLANIYTREAVKYMQEVQAREASEAVAHAQQRLQQVETDLKSVQTRLMNLPVSVTAPASVATPANDPAAERLAAAEDELTGLLARYTDAHPLVREQRARIAALRAQARPAANAPANASPAPAATAAAAQPLAPGDDLELLRHQARNLESTRAQLLNQRHSATLMQSNPPGYVQVLTPAQPENASVSKPYMQIGIFALFFGMVGLVATAATMLGREFMDNRLKTVADVRRVTHLPVIATVGDVNQMNGAERDRWAFRTWTALQRRLSSSSGQGLVCGFTSAAAGEGRTTWIKLLAQAATDRGYRVLTVFTQPGAPANAVEAEVVGADGVSPGTIVVGGEHASVLTTDVLASPGLIIEQLARTDVAPRIDLPLPGWAWNIDRRKQWQEAINTWRKIDNLVILVELPPANVPEAVLLAENIPNLVWLVEAGQSDATQTRQQLETLRQARCNLVGAVLNREIAPPVRQRFTRWLACGAALLTPFLVTPDASAQTRNAEPQPAAGSLMVRNPAERADWQKNLTLGPGDVLNIGLYGEPELVREEVPIGPDGTISFLEARGIPAVGLTVDQLRERLDQALGQFRRSPRTIVLPVAYRSKNYIVLGKVARRGVFPLDRPVTLIEAVARAGGFETGFRNGGLVESADFSRAFLARGDQRVPVDFERLFRQGDLTQNVALAPGDYLYFPSANLSEVYVLGEVRFPGSVGYNSGATGAVAAITGRGGFTDRAWKGRVLVVRGSLQQPQAHVVDVADVLAGRQPDFKLEPRDIVYVSHRPWIRAEELLDIAASSFVQSAVLNWTGLKTGPIIR